MEEVFKKSEEDDGAGVRIDLNAADGDQEGAREFLEGFLEGEEAIPAGGIEGAVVLEGFLEGEEAIPAGGIEGAVVLDGGCRDLEMVSDPSWETIGDEGKGALLDFCQDVFMGEKGQEEAVIGEIVDAGIGAGEEGGILEAYGLISEGKVLSSRQDEGFVKKKGVLNWKDAVMGGGERRKVGIVNGSGGNKVVGEDRVDSGGENDKSSRDGAHQPKAKGVGGGPAKGCRDIKFDERGGGFLAEDGETAHVDREEMLECEKSLERALVGKILGRQVPFGFLHREIRKKWGMFGRIHLSMMGSNSFVCFFASREIRDSVLKGGPWFVGNQLVGVARWSADFDPSSIKGFSTPIWIRLPQLPLNLWSNQNLGRIASLIGKPLWVDEVTSSWGRTEFARVCVRVDFDKKLPKGVWVQGGEKRFFQSVVYEGIEHICFHCGVVGHLNGECLKEVNEANLDGGKTEMVGPQMSFGSNGVVKGKGRHHGSNIGDSTKGDSTCVGRNEVVPANKGGEKEKGKAVVGVFGYQEVEHSTKIDGATSVEGREDLEGGAGWTLVTKKKAKPPKQKPVGKQWGIPGSSRRLVVDGKNGSGKGGDLGRESPLLRPMLVYKRLGNPSSGTGVFSASKCLRPLKGPVENSGPKSGNLKRPKGKWSEAAGSSGGEVGSVGEGGLGEIAGNAMIVYSPAPPSSPTTEGVLKKRRGGDDSVSGGDASLLVIP